MASASASARPPLRARSVSPITPWANLGSGHVLRVKEPAHLPLHRRLLFPTLSPEKPLPPIVQGQGKELPLVNERLYHLIALALRAYILSWYPRFSKDRTLLPLITTHIVVPILSPILTGIYDEPSRVADLVLLDLPVILAAHVRTYWQARSSLALGYPQLEPPGPPHDLASSSSPGTTSPASENQLGIAYHARLPLPSVYPSPTPPPPPDPSQPYRAPTPQGQYVLSPLYLTALADEVLRLHLPEKDYDCAVERMMAREVLGRAVLQGVGRRVGEGWFWWSLGVKLLGNADTTPTTGKSAEPTGENNDWVGFLSVAIVRLWSILWGLWSLTASALALYSAASPVEERYRGCSAAWLAVVRDVVGVDGRGGTLPRQWAMRLVWGGLEAMFNLTERYLDRMLPHIVISMLTPATALRLIDLSERILFPLDGYPAPSPPDLTPEEATQARKAFETVLMQRVHRRIICPDDAHVRALLDPLDDPGCNAHLVGMLLDAVVARLEPRLVAVPNLNKVS